MVMNGIPYGQAKYWVELDPEWDYHSLTEENYPAFFDKTVQVMEPGPTATDNPESISAFKEAGHKLVMWHGWADQMIMPQGINAAAALLLLLLRKPVCFFLDSDSYYAFPINPS